MFAYTELGLGQGSGLPEAESTPEFLAAAPHSAEAEIGLAVPEPFSCGGGGETQHKTQADDGLINF